MHSYSPILLSKSVLHLRSSFPEAALQKWLTCERAVTASFSVLVSGSLALDWMEMDCTDLAHFSSKGDEQGRSLEVLPWAAGTQTAMPVFGDLLVPEDGGTQLTERSDKGRKQQQKVSMGAGESCPQALGLTELPETMVPAS